MNRNRKTPKNAGNPKIRRSTESSRRTSEGFTGLEAAIVLLAFVVVTAAFSYVVLGSGFHTVQKSQAVIYSALEQSSSSILVDEVMYIRNSTSGNIEMIRVYMRSPHSLVPADLSKMTISFATPAGYCTIEQDSPLYDNGNPPAAGKWNIYKNTGSDSGKDAILLYNGDYVIILIHLPEGRELEPGDEYWIEIVQPLGLSMFISRTVPALP